MVQNNTQDGIKSPSICRLGASKKVPSRLLGLSLTADKMGSFTGVLGESKTKFYTPVGGYQAGVGEMMD